MSLVQNAIAFFATVLFTLGFTSFADKIDISVKGMDNQINQEKLASGGSAGPCLMPGPIPNRKGNIV